MHLCRWTPTWSRIHTLQVFTLCCGLHRFICASIHASSFTKYILIHFSSKRNTTNLFTITNQLKWINRLQTQINNITTKSNITQITTQNIHAQGPWLGYEQSKHISKYVIITKINMVPFYPSNFDQGWKKPKFGVFVQTKFFLSSIWLNLSR